MGQHFYLQGTESVGTCIATGWGEVAGHRGEAFTQQGVLGRVLQQAPDALPQRCAIASRFSRPGKAFQHP
ncbi:hypothetical protein D3C80_1980470 [compost metagenome]